ncbi:MAG: aldolase [Sphingomonadales bacterium]|nr:aldolase [Sphingomonadales bacterium]
MTILSSGTGHLSGTPLSSETLHATCVAIAGRAVLIEGPSGAGKSDLALRLIDRGADLVSDDYTLTRRAETTLLASAPPTIAGKIEVRGIGIQNMCHLDDVPVALLVSLSDIVDRLPEPERARKIAGIDIPVVSLKALEASAPIKVEMALVQHGLPGR